MARTPSERTIVFLIGAVQFINILDFMIVMPLGPDFATGLGIPVSHLGTIGGAYTAAAAVSGLLGALFLDRFDRRPALALAMIGLVAGTLAGAFATGLGTLVAARVVAGIFGGPATSLSLSIIADVIPPQRRGRAMGAVMSAFAVASVVGVPAGLELARRGSWRTPFLAVAALGLLLTIGVFVALPPLRGHLRTDAARHPAPFVDLFRRPLPLYALLTTALIMGGTFVLVPNISAYVQYNLGYPRARLGLLYLAGGMVSFVATRRVGVLVDRFGATRVGTVGAMLFIAIVYIGFYAYVPGLPVVAIFIGFMLAASFRAVPFNTLTTRVPLPTERARFMSIQSAVQHGASAVGAFCSSQLLRELPDHRLEGIPAVALVTMSTSLAVPLLLRAMETRVLARDAGASAMSAAAAPSSH